ncbi:uncharacterized protein LOC105159423 isoform X2 [Sesamum indicum]|uniref:Uncharacterized protein LOC105159423 isoform X2 n=1 Tax=Sesamum indicum TaxID=4182 RepID=A0A6I9SVZ5_SESIN|nr:uncharacterized protein LOC105159423 isoform X2 [Sesamum indicum]
MWTSTRLSSCSCSLHRIRACSYFSDHQTSSSNSALFGHQRYAYHSNNYTTQLLFYSNTKTRYIRFLHDDVNVPYFFRNFIVCNNIQPADGQLPPQPQSTFLNWILGVVLAIILPLVTTNRKGPLLIKLKNDVDSRVEAIEEMAETVENVAEAVDKAIDQIAHHLPKEAKLRKVMHIVEDVAEKTAKNAHIIGDVIDELQEIEEKVAKSVVESLREKAIKNSQESKKDEK